MGFRYVIPVAMCTLNIVSHVWVTIMGFGLVIRFIEHLQIVTTSNYRAVANSHTLQFITAHIKSSQPAVSSSVLCFHAHVPTGWWLVLQLTHCSNWLTPITSTSYSFHCCSRLLSNDSCPSYIALACMVQRIPLLTACLVLCVCLLWPLPSNSRCLQSHYFAMAVV
jgi:hypothetical protein